MLVKCVCTNCGHSYLSDDSVGELSCPRCGVGNESARNPSDIPDAPGGSAPGLYGGGHEPLLDDDDIGFYDEEPGFAPEAPPPMFITSDRVMRAFVFGGLAALLTGAAVGAALTATKLAVPGVLAIALSLAAAAGCRAGFGGRSARQTAGRTRVVATLVALVGLAGSVAGSWAVDRFTAERSTQTREDLERGMRDLTEQAATTADEGTRLLLEQRLAEVRRLEGMSNAALEDYLYRQEAQINLAPLAYAKLRATKGPAIQFGPDNDPVELPLAGVAGLLAFELVLAAWLTSRGCVAR